MIAVRSNLLVAGALAVLVVQSSCASGADGTTALDPNAKPLHRFLPVEDKAGVSLAYVWLDIAQEATAQDVDANGARPSSRGH